MTRAIIIVDHGSRREAANHMLDNVVDLVQAQTADRVYAAHMELAEPTIQQAFDRAVAGGADSIFVFPYFLSPGRHSREDIPRMSAAAAARHPGIAWHCSGPIGLDPIMANLILNRVALCEAAAHVCEQCSSPQPCGQDHPDLEDE